MPSPRPYPIGVDAPRAATPPWAVIAEESLTPWSAVALTLVDRGEDQPGDATGSRGDNTLERLTGLSDRAAVTQVDGATRDPDPCPDRTTGPAPRRHARHGRAPRALGLARLAATPADVIEARHGPMPGAAATTAPPASSAPASS